MLSTISSWQHGTPRKTGAFFFLFFSNNPKNEDLIRFKLYLQRIKKNFYYRSVLPSITDSNKDNKSLPVDEEKIPIYNIVSFAQNPLTWKSCSSKLHELKFIIHYSKSVWYPFFIYHKNKYIIELLSILFHWIPGFIIDSIIYLIGKKPM